MKLEIRSFADAGDIERERMSLRVVADADVGDYAILLTTGHLGGGPTSGRKTAYWFPDAKVKAGDLVVVYTKSGDRRTKELSTGHMAHFFYWGLKEPVWDKRNIGCVLLLVDDWKWRSAGEVHG